MRQLIKSATMFAAILAISPLDPAQAQRAEDEMRASYGGQEAEGKGNIKVDSKTKVVKDVSPSDMQAISQAAGRILLHTSQARDAINRQDKNAALDNVNKALTLAKIIENNAPRYKVNTTIHSGDLKYQSEDEVTSSVVPIYFGLEKASVLAPMQAARQGGQQQAQQAQGVRVADVDISAASLQLNVTSAERSLNQAKQALNGGNLPSADNALTGVQDSITFTYLQEEAPLMRARENLALAKAYADADQFDTAKRLVNRVSSSLDNYAKRSGEKQAQQLQDLTSRMDDASKSAKNAGDLSAKIDDWWGQLSNMTTS